VQNADAKKHRSTAKGLKQKMCQIEMENKKELKKKRKAKEKE